MNLTPTLTRKMMFGVVLTSFLGGGASAATFTPGDEAALRQALVTASGNDEADVIDLNGQTFVLEEPLLIVGEDQTLELLDGTLERAIGSEPTRLVEVTGAGTGIEASYSNRVIFNGINFFNGRVDVGDSATNSSGGGAILGNWSVLVENSRFENNAVVGNGSGGAILSNGLLTVLDSVFVNNTALSDVQNTAGFGGAIIVKDEGYRLSGNSFTGNRANAGGALYFSVSGVGSSFVQESFFQGNTATTLGGAIFSAKRSLIVANSTLYENSAGTGGGGIYSQSVGEAYGDGYTSYGVQVRFSALIDNVAEGGSGGGGILGNFNNDTGVSSLANIFGSNIGGNCGVINGLSGGFNGEFLDSLSDDATCGSENVTVIGDVRELFSGELAQNGGATPTFALAPGSIAIDASSGAFCELWDQREVRRPTTGVIRDGVGAFCDIGPYELNSNEFDADGDEVADYIDNCPADANPGQENLDGDAFGDACDDIDNRDEDNDGLENFEDNCTVDANPLQEDSDNDGVGDACDETPTGDTDEDGVDDADDNCRTIPNTDQLDTDNDGAGDLCDVTPTGDEDNDGQDNATDNCPSIANTDQADSDQDGEGDACDTIDNGDSDGDGVENHLDNCPVLANQNQTDSDGDGTGDACTEAVDTGSNQINAQVVETAEVLDGIIAGTSGQTNRILAVAARRLDQALSGNLWESDDELSDRRGSLVFSYVALALNEIERIADYRRTSETLRSELNAVSDALLDNLRTLAGNKIEAAEAVNGTRWRISRASIALRLGDRDRGRDWLKGAADNYGYAWRWANSAY